MPLYRTITLPNNTSINIWKVVENVPELQKNIVLSEVSKSRLATMKSSNQIKCFLAVRQLLYSCSYVDSDLYYNSFGKPFLKNKKNISISHSNEFACIIISDKNVGIDIEVKSEKILKNIPLLFEEDFTYQFQGNLDDKITLLTFCWGIKESLFKLVTKNDISFKENISIQPFTLENKTCQVVVKMNNKTSRYTAHMEEIENYTLVYVID